MNKTNQRLRIRRATRSDVEELKKLYYGTIVTICSRDYTPLQIDAWAATAEKTESLIKRIEEQFFFVALDQTDIIVGFTSIDASGYLDLMYVHKDHQRKGIAQSLFNEIMKTANELGITEMESEVSITAKPFFKKNGFVVIESQLIQINNTELVNFKMKRRLEN